MKDIEIETRLERETTVYRYTEAVEVGVFCRWQAGLDMRSRCIGILRLDFLSTGFDDSNCSSKSFCDNSASFNTKSQP